MRRIAPFCVFGLVAGLGWLAIAAAQTTKIVKPNQLSPAVPAKEAEKKELPAKQAADVDPAVVLSQRVNFPGVNDPKVTVDDVLKDLAKKYNLNFVFNVKAFVAEGIKEPDQLLMAEKPIPAMNNMRLEIVLGQVLARVPCTSGATFLLRSDVIEITTTQYAVGEIWGQDFDGPWMPLVNLRADKTPLNEVLKQLADQSSLNIMFGGPADKAAMPISVRFNNVPVDTAVRLLADQAGLGVVHRDNVLLVTTEEKASAINFRFAEELPEPNIRYRRGGARVLLRPDAPGM